MKTTLQGFTFLVTGIVDRNSLAMAVAKELIREGGTVVCTGLGRTSQHVGLNERAAAFLDRTYADFQDAVRGELGADTLTLPLDVTLDGSIDECVQALVARGVRLNGFLHSIAMDKTIRAGAVKPLIEVTREEFLSAMDVSAYSLISVTRGLLDAGVLQRNASIVALSYRGAEKVMSHPYKNVGVAKAALERIVVELAFELGKSHGIKVNGVRFSPYSGSKAGGAIQGLEEAERLCEEASPLGNAQPEDLGYEVAYLMRPFGRITGEVRYVDGGYHIRG